MSFIYFTCIVICFIKYLRMKKLYLSLLICAVFVNLAQAQKQRTCVVDHDESRFSAYKPSGGVLVAPVLL